MADAAAMAAATVQSFVGSTSSTSFAVWWISSMAILVVIIIVAYYIVGRGKQGRECASMDASYGTLATLSSVFSAQAAQDPNCLFTLKDYYIKSAFNCCSGGAYKADYVDTCVLKDILRQGVRGLDFEVFSVDGQPVVATTTYKNRFVKETYNAINFVNIMQILRDFAFTGGNVPNPTDPIIMHLRFNSEHPEMFSQLASIFKANDQLFMGSAYSYENYGKNIGDMPLLSNEFKSKIIVVVNKATDSSLDNAQFKEYVNVTSGSAFMRYYTNFGIQNSTSLSDIQNYNKTCMTIVGPDAGPNPPSPNAMGCRETGSQLIAMRYQLKDANLEESELFFKTAGYAFVLKPERLRYIPVTVPPPTQQNEALSYASTTTVLPYATITI